MWEGKVSAETEARKKQRPEINEDTGPAGGHLDPHCRPVQSKAVQVRLPRSETSPLQICKITGEGGSGVFLPHT